MPRNRSEKVAGGVSRMVMEYLTAEAMGLNRGHFHNVSHAYMKLGYGRRIRIRNDIRARAGRCSTCTGYPPPPKKVQTDAT